MMDHAVIHQRVPVSVTLADEGILHTGVSVYWPVDSAAPTVALVCLPGGNMNRGYYDLVSDRGGPQEDASFSFARIMSGKGFVVVTVDYLGLGDSDRPVDGFALTPEVLVQGVTDAVATVLGGLRNGSLTPQWPALPALISVGIGHSMGAMMTVLHQARTQTHKAVALLGFTTRGLPDYLPPNVTSLPREEQFARLPEFARQMFKESYPVIRSSDNGARIYGSSNAEKAGVAALKAATDHLLPVPAFMSMLVDNVAPEAAAIDVPVFLGVGDKDMVGPPHQIPAAFKASQDVSLFIMPETGHSHFLFPSRAALFNRLAVWVESVAIHA